MEPLDGPPVSSPDPAISDSVEQLASSSTHAVTDMPFGSSPVQTRTLHTTASVAVATERLCVLGPNSSFNIS